MEREKEMLQAAADTFKVCGDEFDKAIKMLWITAFIAGVDYADRHPKNVWHDASEDPKEPKDLLLIETDGCVKVGYVKRTKSSIRWKTFGRKGKVAKWAYIDDFLPKEGDKE